MVVERDRPRHVQIVRRCTHVPPLVLERELRGVNPYDLEPGPVIRRVPGAQVRQRPDAVDAGVGPEVDEHDLSAQLLQRERPVPRRVQPGIDPGELRRAPEYRQPRSRRAHRRRKRPAATPQPREVVARSFRVLEMRLQYRRVAA